MTTFDEMYAFLKKHYLYSRFEGSGHCRDFPDYPQLVTQSSLEQLSVTGRGFISKFESANGQCIIFDEHLNILDSYQ